MNGINVKQTIMVRPSTETTPRRRIWLSSLDLVARMPYTHSTLIFVYHSIEDDQNKSSSNFFDTNILKDALSRVLVPFYPMAGRLKSNENEGGRLEIDCNDEGVLFVEVETTNLLTDFEDFRPNSKLKKLLIPKCDYTGGISSFPLVLVQLTRFKCGGVTLGFSTHHHLGDGAAYGHFINSWSRLARGLDINVIPIHERRPYLSPRTPPKVTFQHMECDPRPARLSGELGDYQLSMNHETAVAVALFKFSKDQITALKQKVTFQSINYNPTTYEVLAGHIWRSACKARGLNEDQETRLYIPTDGRGRLKNPALPPGFCGNAIFFATCIMKAGDVVNNQLGYVAHKINDTLRRMLDNEYLRSSIDYFETHPNLTALVRGGHTVRCPNISINFWSKLGFYEAQFGWGRPLFVGHGGINYEGQSFIVPNGNGDGGFSFSINLFSHHMALFRKYLYDFDNLFSRI